MIRYACKSPVVAVIPPSSQKERLDTFYYHPLFEDIDDAIERSGAEITDFERATTLITDGTHQTPKYTDKDLGVLFLSSTNISESGVDFSECKYITKDLHLSLSKCQPAAILTTHLKRSP